VDVGVDVVGDARAAAGGGRPGLGCSACGLLYPVVAGVPWLTPEEAAPWSARARSVRDVEGRSGGR
jgi:hypothetical protein